jgi:hypothetical protein
MRYLCIILFFIYTSIHAQSKTIKDSVASFLISDTTNKIQDGQVLIGDVIVSGNKKTKERIIIRETTFKKGDILSATDLAKKITESRQLIYNTALFVDDSVYISHKIGNTVFINIDVKERWYFFPLPYFRLVDRNFNQWWVQENKSLSRVNYGIKVEQGNFSGQNDKVNIWVISGYNQQVTLRYDLPFIDKALTKGFNIGFTYSRQREINYATDSTNKQLFFKLSDNYLRSLTRYDLTYSYRPDQKIRHYFRISYNNEWIADTVLKINPTYYPNHLTNIKYLDFGYFFRYFDVDYTSYPKNGFLGEAFVYKRGLDNITDLWQVGVHALYAKTVFPKTFIHIEGAASIKFPYNNYFFSQPLFGYSYYQMRGMEYYVVDGMAGLLGKFTLHRELFKYVYKNPIHSKTHDRIPFTFYAKIYSDFGYSYTPYPVNNVFNNTLMHTWGVGLDVVSIYDFVFRFEWSFNQLGNNGLYLHARSDF